MSSPTNATKTFSLLASLLVVAGLIALYMLLTNYYPGYKLAKGQEEIALAENDRLKAAKKASEKFLSDFESEKKNVDTANMVLPAKSSDMPNLLNSVTRVAQTGGVNITNFSVEPVNTLASPVENSIVSMEVAMNAVGTYAAFSDFLTRLEQHMRISDVYHITFAGSAVQSAGTPSLEYQVRLRAYYQQ